MPTWMFQLRAVGRTARSFIALSHYRLGSLPAGICLAIFVSVLTLLTPAQTHRTASPSTGKQPPSRESYVGDQACRSCHEEEFKTYQATAHHLTSQVADAHSIAGSFTPDNIFKT